MLGEKRCADLVRAGLERQAKLEIAGALIRLGGIDIGVVELHALPVDAQIELGGRHARAGISANAHQDGVVGVEGKIAMDQDASAFVQRQRVDRVVSGAARGREPFERGAGLQRP